MRGQDKDQIVKKIPWVLKINGGPRSDWEDGPRCVPVWDEKVHVIRRWGVTDGDIGGVTGKKGIEGGGGGGGKGNGRRTFFDGLAFCPCTVAGQYPRIYCDSGSSQYVRLPRPFTLCPSIPFLVLSLFPLPLLHSGTVYFLAPRNRGAPFYLLPLPSLPFFFLPFPPHFPNLLSRLDFGIPSLDLHTGRLDHF
ncbi:hypothetical protein EDB83DRAFT_965994 [Lactarius deliciosus]|nr:hypothetical protein EDB83DRAFT_965994 [Lactarius deliciosus]